MNPGPETLAMLRGQMASILFGTLFLSIGVAACLAAAIRRGRGVRLLFWLGIWSGMYGVGALTRTAAVVVLLPDWLASAVPLANVAIAYLTVVVASRAFIEVSLGRVRRIMAVVLGAGVVVAVLGLRAFVIHGRTDTFILYNQLVAVAGLCVLLTVMVVKRWADRYLVLLNRGVLATGTLAFAVEALYGNLSRPLHLPSSPTLDSVSFACLLFSFGYVAVQNISASERRLLAIDQELEIARRLQFSILPAAVPDVRHLRVAAAYRPMTAVAGDFYEFLPVDRNRVGVLVADVSGHGVPAALVASMIKMAMRAVADSAAEPGDLLRRLGNMLAGPSAGPFVSAAYLWMDTERGRARYSAAGHPPLLHWRAADGRLDRIVSNGLLFGFEPDTEYPTVDVPFEPGDRFFLYTDGVVEPENAEGEPFGDHQLEVVVRQVRSRPASEACERLLGEVRVWQPASVAQQDDITLVVIDVLNGERMAPEPPATTQSTGAATQSPVSFERRSLS